MKKNIKQLLLDSKKHSAFSNKKYMMHKYWGKKPAKELRDIILNYTNEDDLLLDPFAGYGSFSAEGMLSNRKVISNDLNPMSNFINKCLVSIDIDFNKLQLFTDRILEELNDLHNKWYKYQDENIEGYIVSALRTKNGEIKKIRVKSNTHKNIQEIVPANDYLYKYVEKEKHSQVDSWYPNTDLIPNSRISAKLNMKVPDLFDKRSLMIHAKLLELINDIEDCNEKDLLLLAFTSNLANCSKLVPPIKSRGEMSQGAWMTGFYIGEFYIENNVLHYFKNRLNKIISGKKEFITQYYDLFNKGSIIITNDDAKCLNIESGTVDFVFTDFPYGDAVPYFEQSILWNSWMNFTVDYENEIVISDSKERKKTRKEFRTDIEQSISEIYRVLKDKKNFVFTYHSISGFEWISITNSLINSGFIIEDCELLTQKTFTPRQLNRLNTIKGDLVVVCMKDKSQETIVNTINEENYFKEMFLEVIKDGNYFTNDIIVEFLRRYFNNRIVTENENIIKELEKVAKFDGKGWKIYE